MTARWIVLRWCDGIGPEAYPFEDFDDAVAFYERAALQWTDVYLTATVLRPGPPPAWAVPKPASRHEAAVVGAIETVRDLACRLQREREET